VIEDDARNGLGMSGWGWMFMSLGSLLFLVLVGAVIWLLVYATTGGGGHPASAPTGSARETLAQRYARGEIDDEEYQQRLRILTG